MNVATPTPPEASTRPAPLPYPRSRHLRLEGLGDPVRRADVDGDNFPLAWADDDLVYAGYGDGWGCRPVEKPTKLNTGMVRLAGSPPGFTGEEVAIPFFGGGAQDPNLKGCGLLCAGGTLYHFVRYQMGTPGTRQRKQVASLLIWSADHGRTWQGATEYPQDASQIAFFFDEPDHAFHSPTFLQAGRDYAPAQDGYAYLYSPREDERRRNDHLDLARVPVERIAERGAFEFFAGLEDSSRPTWTRDIARRAPVFGFPNHVAPGDVVYLPAIARYLLVCCESWESVQAAPSDLALFDAPAPWGPWTSVGYVTEWGSGQGGDCRYDPRLPVKWLSADGAAATLVFSDRTQSDVLNYQELRFRVL